MRAPVVGAGPDSFALLLEQVERGDRRALARAITAVETGDAEARRLALALDWPPGAAVIALTGPPGVGKSSLADGLAATLSRDGYRVAVLAVDPTSPRSGGAVLGDRVRLTADDGAVFFRSMAARGGGQGLAPETPAVLRLLAAGGATRILLETAGVGQGDHAVTRLADLTVAVAAPRLGDAVQAAKAGLFEVADLVVVNQADRPGAEALAAAFRSFRAGPVLLTSTQEGAGLGELAASCAGATRRTPAEKPRARGAIRLHHVGLAVKDGGAAARLWRGLLGLREHARYRVDEFGVLALFLTTDKRPSAAASGALVELLEPVAPDGPIARFLSRRGEGLHHICFEVEDIEETLAALAARGVRLVDRTPRRGAGGRLVAFIHPKSAGGVLLELKQAGESDG